MANQRPLVWNSVIKRRAQIANGDTLVVVPVAGGLGLSSLAANGTGVTVGLRSNGGTPEGQLQWVVSNAEYASAYASSGLNLDVAANDFIVRRGGTEKARVTSTGLTLSDAAPELTLADTTANAKSLRVKVDADVANLREAAGADGSLMALDLVNNRVGLGTSAPQVRLHNRADDAGSANIVELARWERGGGSGTSVMGYGADLTGYLRLNSNQTQILDDTFKWGSMLNSGRETVTVMRRLYIEGALRDSMQIVSPGGRIEFYRWFGQDVAAQATGPQAAAVFALKKGPNVTGFSGTAGPRFLFAMDDDSGTQNFIASCGAEFAQNADGTGKHGGNIFFKVRWDAGAAGTGAAGADASANTTVLYCTYNGNVVLGPQVALATSAAAGFPYLPYISGTPTGSPASYTGHLPVILDDSGSRIWVKFSSGWKSVALA